MYMYTYRISMEYLRTTGQYHPDMYIIAYMYKLFTPCDVHSKNPIHMTKYTDKVRYRLRLTECRLFTVAYLECLRIEVVQTSASVYIQVT